VIIWDEYKYGELLYNRKSVTTSKWQYKELRSLIYYLLENGVQSNGIRTVLLEVCNDEVKYLAPEQRDSLFNKLITQCKSSKMITGIEVVVYDTELKKIRELANDSYEKCVFVMLVYKKWLDKVKDLQGFDSQKKTPYYDWFAMIKADIFKEAKLAKMNSKAKQLMMTYLYENGFILSEVKKLTRGDRSMEKVEKKQMWSLPFMAAEGDAALKITNYADITEQYLNHVYGGFRGCKCCEKLFTPSNNRQIYCPECKTEVNREKTKARISGTRNV